MKSANLSDVKNQLSRYIRMVRDGETVRVFLRGVAVADIVPISARGRASAEAEEARLADLERRGIIERGSGGIEPDLLSPGPKVRGEQSLAETISEDRQDRV